MKKAIISIALACISGLTASAQINGDGYYRVQNATTKRYMSLTDNTSRGIDVSSTTVEAMALLTKKNWEEVSTDPGTVFYITKANSDEYNIKGQGSSLYDMIKYYIRLRYYQNGNMYRAWQSKSGATIYLSDENQFTIGDDIGFVDNNVMSAVNWYITKVDTEDNYLGVKPTVTANGKHYATFYASFPFSVTSDKMKVYYISAVNESKGNAVYKELTGVIPASTPVIIECESTDPAQNKLKIEETSNAAAIKDNQMTGVYFSIGSRLTAHYNSVEFKPETMRVLGVAEDGSLTFNDADTNMEEVLIRVGNYPSYTYPSIKAIPHNTGYLKVSANCPKELKVMDETTGIKDLTTDKDNKPADIYSISGVKVREKATTVEGLPQGIYIFKGKKVIVK